MKERKELIAAARGELPCDLVLKNGRVVNTFTQEVLEADVGVKGRWIAGVGEVYEGAVEIDLDGAWVAPGFIESHFHIESTMLRPSELVRLVVPRGTTCLVADPHEIANVAGPAGIEFFLDDSENVPLDLFLMAPSCVPATDFETSGASVSDQDIEDLYRHPRVLGLGEVMNFPGVVQADPGVLKKIEVSRGRPIDGHAPLLSGKDLCAYLAAGPRSDHEASDPEEALEKARLGMWIMIREGADPGNLRRLASVISDRNCGRFMLATDDKAAADLINEGHMDFLLRQAVEAGIDPVTALRLVTLNPAQYFGFSTRGAVAPGYLADLVVLKDLASFEVRKVIKSGQCVAEEGVLTGYRPSPAPVPSALLNTVHLPHLEEELWIRFDSKKPRARVIELIPGAILTGGRVQSIPVDEKGRFAPEGEDLSALFVLERHGRNGNTARGLVSGFGLERGALASTVAHDSHNIICVAADPVSAVTAVKSLVDRGGGLCAAVGTRVLAAVDLPIAGLVNEGPYEVLLDQMSALIRSLAETGTTIRKPFFYLSFLALPVIPELKITDRGLFDVSSFSPVELEVRT